MLLGMGRFDFSSAQIFRVQFHLTGFSSNYNQIFFLESTLLPFHVLSSSNPSIKSQHSFSHPGLLCLLQREGDFLRETAFVAFHASIVFFDLVEVWEMGLEARWIFAFDRFLAIDFCF